MMARAQRVAAASERYIRADAQLATRKGNFMDQNFGLASDR